MFDSQTHPAGCGTVDIQLLDAVSGRPVTSWSFKNQDKVTIGRSSEQSVELSDPYVSRLHASLEFRGHKWILVSHGRNGIYVNNQLVKERVTGQQIQFRLGSEGPILKFTLHHPEKLGEHVPKNDDIMATVNLTENMLEEASPGIQLDMTRLQNDVQAIAENDYFVHLQSMAKVIRQKRSVQNP